MEMMLAAGSNSRRLVWPLDQTELEVFSDGHCDIKRVSHEAVAISIRSW